MQLADRLARRWLATWLAVAIGVTAVQAADHVDSPLSTANKDLDITDVYIFRSPVNNDNLVIAVNHQSIFDFVGGNTGGNLFANDGLYQTFIDRDGDLVPDITITTRFFGEGANQRFFITGLTTGAIIGNVTQLGAAMPTVVTQEGIQAFAGPRDDPFFFDLPAFNAFVAAPYVPAAGLRAAGAGAPTNFFQGNVASIVLEIPITRLTGLGASNLGRVGIWAKTFRLR